MSCPHIVPKGNDRSWTRAFYQTLRRVTRYMWWKQNMEAQVSRAMMDTLTTGRGFIHIKGDTK
jgi:hypothetical protein